MTPLHNTSQRYKESFTCNFHLFFVLFLPWIFSCYAVMLIRFVIDVFIDMYNELLWSLCYLKIA
jgi:hypothetical protein